MERYYFDIYGLPKVVLDYDGITLSNDKRARDVAVFMMSECYRGDLFESERGRVLSIKVSREDGLFVSDVHLSINNKPLAGEVRRPAADVDLPNIIPFPSGGSPPDGG